MNKLFICGVVAFVLALSGCASAAPSVVDPNSMVQDTSSDTGSDTSGTDSSSGAQSTSGENLTAIESQVLAILTKNCPNIDAKATPADQGLDGVTTPVQGLANQDLTHSIWVTTTGKFQMSTTGGDSTTPWGGQSFGDWTADVVNDQVQEIWTTDDSGDQQVAAWNCSASDLKP
jgi:hypothetical protein